MYYLLLFQNISISLIFTPNHFQQYYILLKYQRINNLFFYNVFIGSIGSGLFSLLLFKSTKKYLLIEKPFRPFLFVISVLLSFSFLSTIPLTIDRSYSVWILKYVSESSASNQNLSAKILTNESLKFFSESNGQLSRRIAEQERLGNIISGESGEIKITWKGRTAYVLLKHRFKKNHQNHPVIF
jgi:hypothetical protein